MLFLSRGKNVFFTADEHFGHKNIIKYCKRPFNSVEEMDAIIIANFNSIVKKDDFCYHLGDFTLKDGNKYVKMLNGNHIFIPGGHDKWIKNKNLNCIQNFSCDVFDFVLCHYPIDEWEKKYYGSIHLHGHSHGKSVYMKNRLDVGVDTNNFFPYSLNDVINKIFIEY